MTCCPLGLTIIMLASLALGRLGVEPLPMFNAILSPPGPDIWCVSTLPGYSIILMLGRRSELDPASTDAGRAWIRRGRNTWGERMQGRGGEGRTFRHEVDCNDEDDPKEGAANGEADDQGAVVPRGGSSDRRVALDGDSVDAGEGQQALHIGSRAHVGLSRLLNRVHRRLRGGVGDVLGVHTPSCDAEIDLWGGAGQKR